MLHSFLNRFSQAKVLVLGDAIVDQFIWGTASRISPEAPVPVVNVTGEQLLLGGSANVVSNIIALGGQASLCGTIGNDIMGNELRTLMRAVGASVEGLIQGKRPTTLKTRVVAQGQQVVRYDREEVGPPSERTLEDLQNYLQAHLADFDVVVVSDYAKGVINAAVMQQVQEGLLALRQSGRKIPLIVDPKPIHLSLFSGATVITPNHLEAAMMSGIEIRDRASLEAAARCIQERLTCEAVLITRGEAGMALLEGQQDMVLIPTMAKEVYDVTGAGDTVVAVLALGLAVGCSMIEAAQIANYAAGIVVGKRGTASVCQKELRATLI
jgi:D-beta-D-heptose 7-phosphate kinase/D-beta-D-heptose 1-phosphate adenosyltransferase